MALFLATLSLVITNQLFSYSGYQAWLSLSSGKVLIKYDGRNTDKAVISVTIHGRALGLWPGTPKLPNQRRFNKPYPSNIGGALVVWPEETQPVIIS